MKKLFWVVLLCAISGCPCGTCPRPTIVGVPPAGDLRQDFELPLDTAKKKKAVKRYLLECGPVGGIICEGELTAEQQCAIKALSSMNKTIENLTKCPNGILLTVYDARLEEGDDIDAVAVGGWVFTVYPNGYPPDQEGTPRLIVFSDYVPVPAD